MGTAKRFVAVIKVEVDADTISGATAIVESRLRGDTTNPLEDPQCLTIEDLQVKPKQRKES